MLQTTVGRATYDYSVGVWHVINDQTGETYRNESLDLVAVEAGLTEQDVLTLKQEFNTEIL